jgi:Curli production assembly/transport component CsgG
MKHHGVRTLTLLVFLLCAAASLRSQDASINSMAGDLAKALTAGRPKRVAVVDFTDLNSTVTSLGKHFAQEFEIDLATSPVNKVDLVNRTRLQQIIKEQKLNTTGLVDPDTARQLGKFAGVEALIVGTVTPLDETVRLDVEAIDTEDARVLAATSRNILKTRDIRLLLGESTPVPSPGSEADGPVPSSAPAQTLPQAAQVFESHDIQFVLNSCAREAASIVCRLTITNKGEDRNIHLAGHCNGNSNTRFIDGIGREFKASEELLGSRRDDGCGPDGTLVNNVPTRTEVRFDNIPPDVTSISLFELPSNTNNLSLDASFHKVPLTQEQF